MLGENKLDVEYIPVLRKRLSLWTLPMENIARQYFSSSKISKKISMNLDANAKGGGGGGGRKKGNSLFPRIFKQVVFQIRAGGI